MIILMKETATSEQIQRVVNRLEEMGFRVNRSKGVRHTVVGVLAAQVDIDICKIAILPGVQSVHRISACVSADAEQPILDRYLSSCGLTMREREVVCLLIEGYSNKEIASRWDITEWTVKDHLKNIYSKLGIHHRTALVAQILRFVSQRNEAQNPEPPIPRGVGPPLIGVNARARLGSRS